VGPGTQVTGYAIARSRCFALSGCLEIGEIPRR
jgi:hypothetical protein